MTASAPEPASELPAIARTTERPAAAMITPKAAPAETVVPPPAADAQTPVVIEDQQIGSEDSPIIELPKPKLIQVPGFEIIIFIISMILIVIILKIRKNI